MTSTFKLSGLAALSFCILAASALAQTPPPPPSPPVHEMRGERMHEMMQKHREAMMQDLRTVLHIRPDQEPAFSAFEASMTPPPREERMKRDRAAMETMTTPQKLDMMQARMAEHMARMQKHIAAVKTFYAALSPEQQHVFDALHRMHGGMGGFGGHGGHGMGGGRGGHGGTMMGDKMGGPGEGPPPPPPGA